jgi:hypothetical protein
MANWYLDAAVGSSGNGTSWGTAWKASSNVVWGASGVKAGDTLYVATGSYVPLTVGASGTLANRITIRASQDTHTGTATFSGSGSAAALNISGNSYITVNGEYGGAQNLTFTNSGGAAAGVVKGDDGSPTYITISYCNISNAEKGITITFGSKITVDHCTITDIYGDHAFYTYGQVLAFGEISIHHNTIQLRRDGTGYGPDGIQGLHGVDFYNNTIYAVTGSLTNPNHQDFIQAQGRYWRIYNNDFLNSGDSSIDFDYFTSGEQGLQHVYIYNNTFRITDTSATLPYPQAIRTYKTAAGGYTIWNDVIISNNTFIDVHFPLWRFHDSSSAFAPTVTNSVIKNNLFVNSGVTNPINEWQNSPNAVAADYGFDYNCMGGSYTQFQVDGATYTQAHPRTGIPTFVSYTYKSASNDLHLAANDTVAKGQGVDLSAYFTTDKDGTLRTAPWSIGAYHGAGTSPPAGLITLSVR